MTAPAALGVPTLSNRELNRATLARQMLLERVERPALEVIGCLVGMQAQEPFDPYLGLWSRIEGFDPLDLARLLLDRRAVRATLLRGTIHLVGAGDFRVLRPLVQPLLDRTYRNGRGFGGRVAPQVRDQVLQTCAEELRKAPRTRAELRQILHERWPEEDAAAMSFLLYAIPLIQAPPRGVWGRTGPARWAPAEDLLGPGDLTPAAVDDLVERYLGAFGPATVGDARVWSGITGLKEVFERLRPRLMAFRDHAGRELFDLPDAPRPDAGTPAPPRFLPQFDNLLLSHDDRSRMTPEQLGPGVTNVWNAVVNTGPAGKGGRAVRWSMFTVDGFAAGAWRLERSGENAVLFVRPIVRLPEREVQALFDEGRDLLSMLAADADPSVREVRFLAGH